MPIGSIRCQSHDERRCCGNALSWSPSRCSVWFGLGKQLPGLGLQNELALLVDSGLTPLAALQAATVTAAQALGQSANLGSLENGKLADIVVLEADPLADIQNARRVRLVLK